MEKIGRPNLNDAPGWYAYFFDLVTGNDLIKTLEDNKAEMLALIRSIPASLADFSYAEGKWSIKQAFIHLADEERYYAYKAFCYSRQTGVFLEIPMGKQYVKDFNADNRTLADIADELLAVRNATISLFSTMTVAMLDFKDLPGKEVYSARSLGWFAAGHNIHHLNLIREKYLASAP